MKKPVKILLTIDNKFKEDFEKFYKKNRPAITNLTQAIRAAMHEMMQTK